MQQPRLEDANLYFNRGLCFGTETELSFTRYRSGVTMHEPHYLAVFSGLLFMSIFSGFFRSQKSDLKKAETLDRTASNLSKQGRFSEAIPVAEEALVIREKALGREHLDVVASLISLADLYKSLRNYTRAECLYKRSLAITDKTLGPDHPFMSISLYNLAELYHSIGNYSEAESFYKSALALIEKSFGEKHAFMPKFLNGLALLYDTLGDYAKEEPLLKKALAITEKLSGPENRCGRKPQKSGRYL